jgi:hypothetical protein
MTATSYRTSLAALLILFAARPAARAAAPLFDHAAVRHWIDELNQGDPEDVNGGIPNSQVWAWMSDNTPWFTCSDPAVEQMFYYRWWAYRKHIETTPAGYVITEFLRPVKHATQYNAISCAAGLHIAEGRWLRNPRYLDDYIRFWLHGGPDGALQPKFHQYSGWMAAAAYQRWLVDGDKSRLVALLDALVTDYRAWESERLLPSGLFWQRDVSDGMESSISGGRRVKNVRPTINSYMYGNARAIAAIAEMAGKPEIVSEYRKKADTLRQLVEEKLWNPKDEFFETLLESGTSANVRELQGYTPWYFNLPQSGKGYEQAWKQLMDPRGFYAPYGPTTAERRNPEFLTDQHDDCQWNGFSWPFATSIALGALANLLNGPAQTAISPADYYKTFMIYTKSQHLKLDDGRVIPWVDEDLDPLTGVWQARALKIRKKTFYGRGDHYNHSSYADLLISGLLGLRPSAGDTLEVHPLLPPGTWDWFCLDQVAYHGHLVGVLWDRTGRKFHRGAGLRLFVDGKEVAHSAKLQKLTGAL